MSDFRTYLFSYPYKGGRWGFQLQAESLDDAEARLKAIGWGKVDGELKVSIPVTPRRGWLRWLGL